MTDLDPIMQAAERLRRRMGDISWNELCEMYDLAGMRQDDHGELRDAMQEDDIALARFLLTILPKGKRPVALEKATAEFWILNDLGQVFKAKFPSADASQYWDGIRESIGEIGFATEAEANLAKHYWTLEQLAAR